MSANSNNNKFEASASTLGYLYQLRYALWQILEKGHFNPSIEVRIESLDDVVFDINGAALELVQTKHRLNKIGDLSDASTDLWKAIRIWSEQVLSEIVYTSNTLFSLITTGKISQGSVAYLLSSNKENRNTKEALKKLLKTAEESENTANQKAYEAFTKLSGTAQLELLEAITIYDASPNIIDTRKSIAKLVRYAAEAKHQDALIERLEGWWFNAVINMLQSRNLYPSIGINEIDTKINELRESFKSENLPVDYRDYIPPEDPNSYKRTFVEQLNLINIHDDRIGAAVRDYYRAFEQRSRWLRDELLFREELSGYDKKLKEEWRLRFFDSMEDFSEETPESKKVESGRAVYRWAEQEAVIPIRSCNEEYVRRGSYHILADEIKLGWHPEFEHRVKHPNGRKDK